MKFCDLLVKFTSFVSYNYPFKNQEIFKSLFSASYILFMHYTHFHRGNHKCNWFYELLYFLLGKKDFLLWQSYLKIVFFNSILKCQLNFPIRKCLAADALGSNQSWLLRSVCREAVMTLRTLLMCCRLLFVHSCDSTDEIQHWILGSHLWMFYFM